jgi:hypothetical protein
MRWHQRKAKKRIQEWVYREVSARQQAEIRREREDRQAQADQYRTNQDALWRQAGR